MKIRIVRGEGKHCTYMYIGCVYIRTDSTSKSDVDSCYF